MVKLISVLAVLGIVAALSAYAAGYLDPAGDRYEMAPATARERLTRLGLPPELFSGYERFETSSPRPDRVEWTIYNGDAPGSRYVATLQAAGAKETDVVVDFLGVTPDIARRVQDNPAARHVMILAMRENIRATLEGRPFDANALHAAALVAYVVGMASGAAPLNATHATPEFQDPATPLR